MFWWLENIWHFFFPKKEIIQPNPIVIIIVYYVEAHRSSRETVLALVEGFQKQIERWRTLQPDVTFLDLIVAGEESRIDIKYLTGTDQSDTDTLKALRSYLQSELTINNPVEFFEA